MLDPSTTVIVWNVEWSPSKWQRVFVTSFLKDRNPDLVCVTEGVMALFDGKSNLICSGEDFGYPNDGGKRKVWLQSRSEWTDVDTVGSADLPPGRFVSGITNGIRVAGVCIPWRSAHVSSGHKNRKPWEDHISYLAALSGILARYKQDDLPVCILGDFNQRIPAIHDHSKVFGLLMSSLSPEFKVHTAGVSDKDGERLIDHVATSQSLIFRLLDTQGRETADGQHISDHPAIIGTLTHLKKIEEL